MVFSIKNRLHSIKDGKDSLVKLLNFARAPEKVIFNFFSHDLSDDHCSVKVSNFQFLLNVWIMQITLLFEILFRDCGVVTNFESFLPISYKHNLIFTLLHRGFMICCSYRTLHFEILKLKQIF